LFEKKELKEASRAYAAMLASQQQSIISETEHSDTPKEAQQLIEQDQSQLETPISP
jgi:hypothetical protein